MGEKIQKNDSLDSMSQKPRKFEILQRKFALDEEQKDKIKSAILIGLCILRLGDSICLGGVGFEQAIQQEIQILNSLKLFGKVLSNIGYVTTLLAVGVENFIAKYFPQLKKKMETVSVENKEELGKNFSAKSR